MRFCGYDFEVDHDVLLFDKEITLDTLRMDLKEGDMLTVKMVGDQVALMKIDEEAALSEILDGDGRIGKNTTGISPVDFNPIP